MSRRGVTEKGGETRARLVESAAALFLERGYSATSLSDLIAAAGLTKGGFYFHFASKAEVALEVVRSRAERLQSEVLAAASEYERASEQIAAMVRALVGAIGGDQKQGMGGLERLCAELRAEGVDDPAVVQPHLRWVETTAELFRRAQAEGDMDAAADPVREARFAVASFVGLEEMARTDPSARGVLGVKPDVYLRLVSRAVGLRVPELD
jgi:AcrR family transcriptional regulator